MIILFITLTVFAAMRKKKQADRSLEKIHLIVLDPGHFHAALVQKSIYPDVSQQVNVYAPSGEDLQAYLKLIDQYNSRTENPTDWKENIYQAPDFYSQMLKEKPGSLVVLAGNNKKKIDYIIHSVSAGFNVLSDKPMAIDQAGFRDLKRAFDIAARKKVLLYDIMTERFTIHSILQRELSQEPALFGKLAKGSFENPSVVKESVHHFFKEVSGIPLIRPTWYYDTAQEGEGLVDVTTHLVDLVQWQCFPRQIINYQKDIRLLSARHWPTLITAEQFKRSTRQEVWPSYLASKVKKDTLSVLANGEMNYVIKNIHSRVSVRWDFEARTGSGDTHYALMRGTKASLIIRQGAEQHYLPVLYIEANSPNMHERYHSMVASIFKKYQQKYPGLSFKANAKGWEVIIPSVYIDGHEAQFGAVTKQFLTYIHQGKLPAWEVPNMLAKYYTTTTALAVARR